MSVVGKLVVKNVWSYTKASAASDYLMVDLPNVDSEEQVLAIHIIKFTNARLCAKSMINQSLVPVLRTLQWTCAYLFLIFHINPSFLQSELPDQSFHRCAWRLVLSKASPGIEQYRRLYCVACSQWCTLTVQRSRGRHLYKVCRNYFALDHWLTFFLDPSVECTGYFYAPVSNQLSSFPIVSQPAQILPGDATAQAKWASISGSVPNIAPRVPLNMKFVNDFADSWS